MSCARCGKEEEEGKEHLTSQIVERTPVTYYNCIEGVILSQHGPYALPLELLQRIQYSAQLEQQVQELLKTMMGIIRSKGIMTPQGHSIHVLKQHMESPGHININVEDNGHQRVTVSEKPLIAQQVIKA